MKIIKVFFKNPKIPNLECRECICYIEGIDVLTIKGVKMFIPHSSIEYMIQEEELDGACSSINY